MKIKRLRKKPLTEAAISPFVEDDIINKVRGYEMQHLPYWSTSADVEHIWRTDKAGGKSPEDMCDIIKASICYDSKDDRVLCTEKTYKVFDDGRVEEISHHPSLDKYNNYPWLQKYRKEAISNESLTEAAPRKTVKVDPVYNGEHDEPIYFSNIRDAYKFANQLIENDREIGLDRIYILYNYTEGYINCWVNDKRGWRNPESIPTNGSLKGNKSEEIMKIKRLRRVNESNEIVEAVDQSIFLPISRGGDHGYFTVYGTNRRGDVEALHINKVYARSGDSFTVNDGYDRYRVWKYTNPEDAKNDLEFAQRMWPYGPKWEIAELVKEGRYYVLKDQPVETNESLTEAAEGTVYVMVAGRDSQVFRDRLSAEARSKRYNNNVSMSGSNEGYSYVVETTLQ